MNILRIQKKSSLLFKDKYNTKTAGSKASQSVEKNIMCKPLSQ